MARSADTENSPEPLAERLRARIRREGPISFRDWMEAALYDPIDGYYFRADRIRQGRAGDYRTAPESSPLFAATFGRYFAKLFSELGSPSSWTIFEVGAGTGEFAHGVLSSLRSRHRDVFAATTYVIDEISRNTRARASERLFTFDEQVRFRPLTEVEKPAHTGIVFSNELIDAFPVHRVTLRDGKLRELYVDLDEDDFVWVECHLDPDVADYCQHTELQLVEGQIIELNLDAEVFLSRAASSLESGFVITVDYGAERNELLSVERRRQGTLRAFRHHQLSGDVLSRPGEQDLTTTIDWTQMREAGKRLGLQTIRHEPLDQFLLSEGLLEELEFLARTLSQADSARLRTTAREMILPQGLAASFQVLIQKK